MLASQLDVMPLLLTGFGFSIYHGLPDVCILPRSDAVVNDGGKVERGQCFALRSVVVLETSQS